MPGRDIVETFADWPNDTPTFPKGKQHGNKDAFLRSHSGCIHDIALLLSVIGYVVYATMGYIQLEVMMSTPASSSKINAVPSLFRLTTTWSGLRPRIHFPTRSPLLLWTCKYGF